MTLEQAMVGRPRTTCKPSAHHKRGKNPRRTRREEEPIDRLTPLRHKLRNGRVVRTHYHKRMGFATPRHSYGESRGAAVADSVCKAERKLLCDTLRSPRETATWEISPSLTDRT
jgi:hypothetical protein